jgi:Response regulator containing a CheY-like receiver domain and an HD-GYP domain
MKKVLIIDDSTDIVSSLVDFLEEEKFETHFAYNGEQALRLTEEIKPDLIICDILMPGMNGYEFYEKIKDNESTADIPIIFITAGADNFCVQHLKEAGVKHFIMKPYRITDILKIINSILEK